jgi:hypothetical protein
MLGLFAEDTHRMVMDDEKGENGLTSAESVLHSPLPHQVSCSFAAHLLNMLRTMLRWKMYLQLIKTFLLVEEHEA